MSSPSSIPVEQNNYLNGRAADGEEGWVWTPNIRVFALPGPTVAAAGPPETYRSCPLEGSAEQEFRRQSNRLKKRNTAPTPAQIDPARGGGRSEAGVESTEIGSGPYVPL